MTKSYPPAVTTGTLGAHSISVMCSTGTICNGRCLACISRNTGGGDEKEVEEIDLGRLESRFSMARALGARFAIITDKRDPLQERDLLLGRIIQSARAYGIPRVDMHTNGLLLQTKRGQATFRDLVELGLTNITFSIASFNPCVNQQFMGIDQRPLILMKLARELKLTTRCSLLLTGSTIYEMNGILEYVRQAKKLGVGFIVIREIWIPAKKRLHEVRDQATYEWCLRNQVLVQPLIEEMGEMVKRRSSMTELEPLPWGQRVFDIYDVNVTFARCDDGQMGQTLKSVVAKPDGELYRGWDNEADKLW